MMFCFQYSCIYMTRVDSGSLSAAPPGGRFAERTENNDDDDDDDETTEHGRCHYTSPEELSGSSASDKSDIWWISHDYGQMTRRVQYENHRLFPSRAYD